MAVLDIVVNAENNAQSALRQVNRQLGDLGETADRTNSRLGQTRRFLGRGMRVAAGVAIGAATAVGGALLGVAADGTRMAADLEAQMSGIAAVLGATREEIEPLRDTILELGMDPNLKVDTQEAAAAIEMLARNGLNMTQIMDGAARSTVLLANATGAEFATAADIATDSMSIFNIAVEDMDQAVNQITGVVNNSKFDIEDYRLALAQAGGVATSVGVEFEDFNTSIAAISPLFASGSDAGTSFKTFLQRLAPDTKKAREAMTDLNLITSEGENRFFDATGALKDMDEISGLLQNALEGLSEEQTNMALQTIFGTDAMRAAVGLARVGQDEFNALKTVVGNTDAEQAAATRMDNLRGAMEILSGVVEATSIRIGQLFIPVLTGMARAAASFLDEHADAIVGFFEDVIDAVPDAVDRIGNFVDRVRDVIDAALDFISPVTDALTSFVEWRDVAIGAGIALGIVFLPAIVGAGVTLLGLAGTVAIVSLAFGGIVLAVAALRTAWENDWGGIQTKTEAVVGVLTTKFATIRDWLATSLPGALTKLKNTWGGVWDTVQPRVQTAWDAIRPHLESMRNWFLVTLPTAWDAMGLFFVGVWATVQATVTTVWANIQPTLGAFLGWFETDLPTAVESARQRFDTALAAVRTALDRLQTKWTEVWDVIQPRVQTAWDAIRPHLQTMRTWFFVTLPAALTVTGAFFTGAWAIIQNTVTNAWNNVGPTLTAIKTWFDTTLPEAITAARDSVSTQVGNIRDKLDELTQPVRDLVTEFVEWKDIVIAAGIVLGVVLAPAVGAAIVALGSLAASIALPIVAFGGLVLAVAAVRNAWERDWGGIQEKTQGAIDAITEAIDGLLELFAPEFEALSESFQEMIGEFGEMGPELQALWTEVQPILAGIGVALSIVAGIFGIVLTFAIKAFVQSLSTSMRVAGDVVETVVQQMTDTIKTIKQVWKDTVRLVKAIIDGDFSDAWDAAKDIARTFADFWFRTMRRIWTLAVTYFVAVKDTVGNALESMGVDAGAIMDSFFSWWRGILRSLWVAAVNRFVAIRDSVTSALEAMGTLAKDTLETIQGWWDKKFGALLNKVQPVVDAINDIKAAFENVSDYLSDFSFPSINWPQPSAWITGGGNINYTPGGGGGGTAVFSQQAAGTRFFRGGLATINERGPEPLILPGRNRQAFLPRGTQIVPAEAAAGAGSGDIHVHLDGMVVSNDMDIESLAWRVASTIKRNQRS